MAEYRSALQLMEMNAGTYAGEWIASTTEHRIPSPVDGQTVSGCLLTDERSYESVIERSHQTFLRWRETPAPKRGELVRELAEAFRLQKEPLAQLIAHENGKIIAEARGEVQELIDIADFAVGLSRQLYGYTMHSERFHHRMYEQWHPLGPVGIITAFNFPLAVWGWNAMLAAVCGDSVIWKPSELTSITAIAATKVCAPILERHGVPALFGLITGEGSSIGERLARDRRIPLISATGSCAMGRRVGEVVAQRLGRTLLELGGNNALIVLDDADLELALRAIFFGAVGTAGQRCTTTRRVLVQAGILEKLSSRLVDLYRQIRIGDPRDSSTLMGPLISETAVKHYEAALAQVSDQGGRVLCGAKRVPNMPTNFYVEPTLVQATKAMPLTFEETFAPITYLIPVSDLDEAISVNNQVTQGLSSSIFTRSIASAEKFLSAAGSDCGIANVNLGTSGAEIGGAFGGEKDTGGGREAGSDSWRAYMRRQTNTINWSAELPLAQGIVFGDA